jgi:hypothetical protein
MVPAQLGRIAPQDHERLELANDSKDCQMKLLQNHYDALASNESRQS